MIKRCHTNVHLIFLFLNQFVLHGGRSSVNKEESGIFTEKNSFMNRLTHDSVSVELWTILRHIMVTHIKYRWLLAMTSIHRRRDHICSQSKPIGSYPFFFKWKSCSIIFPSIKRSETDLDLSLVNRVAKQNLARRLFPEGSFHRPDIFINNWTLILPRQCLVKYFTQSWSKL